MPRQPGFWDAENNRRLDQIALAEYDRSLQLSHQRRRPVLPAAISYELSRDRESQQQFFEPIPTDPRFRDRAEAFAAFLRETHFEVQPELQLDAGFAIYSDGESDTEASFQASPESVQSEIAKQANERLGNLTTDLGHLAISTPEQHPDVPLISLTDYDSDSSTIIFTPPTPRQDIMDEDDLAEYRRPLHAHDIAEPFAAGVDDDDEDMGESEVEMGFGDSEGEAGEDDLDPDAAPAAPFNPIAMGLKEIGGLARFRVSSYKPGNGVQELVNDDIDRYWQSDGIQPHRLTMTFVKCVEIRALRFYVDYTQDESYTPTRISWFAGTSEHDLHAFGTSNLVNPSGWIDVPLTGTGGGEDGNSLMAWVVQMQIIENHQNGKDTHIRAVKVYGFDDQLRAAGATGVGREEGQKDFRVDETKDAEENEKAFKDHLRGIEFTRSFQDGDPSGTASSLDFMEDPVIR